MANRLADNISIFVVIPMTDIRLYLFILRTLSSDMRVPYVFTFFSLEATDSIALRIRQFRWKNCRDSSLADLLISLSSPSGIRHC